MKCPSPGIMFSFGQPDTKMDIIINIDNLTLQVGCPN